MAEDCSHQFIGLLLQGPKQDVVAEPKVIRSLGVADCSWVELVASGPQRPHTFISHSWKDFRSELRVEQPWVEFVSEVYEAVQSKLISAIAGFPPCLQEFFRDFMSTVLNLEMERGLTVPRPEEGLRLADYVTMWFSQTVGSNARDAA